MNHISTLVLIACIKADLKLDAVTEYRFAPPRRWRFDIAIPSHKIAIELEGGVFTGGRHTRGTGYLNDIEKYTAATLHGWRLLRYAHVNGKTSQIINDLRILTAQTSANVNK